jgi:hypothetical protein
MPIAQIVAYRSNGVFGWSLAVHIRAILFTQTDRDTNFNERKFGGGRGRILFLVIKILSLSNLG